MVSDDHQRDHLLPPKGRALCSHFGVLFHSCLSEQLILVALLQVDEIYTVPEVGTVVGGTLSR